MASNNGSPTRQEPVVNPNALHDFHIARRGPKNVPDVVTVVEDEGMAQAQPGDPGHPYAATGHVSFEFYHQHRSNAPFGYDHFVSVPPQYHESTDKSWPLILSLHGAGESQRKEGESYASLRHGIPKVILAYDSWRCDPHGSARPSIDIPMAPRLRKSKRSQQGDDRSSEAVPPETCALVAQSFITVTPSLNMSHGYGWNASILSALLDEIVRRYRVDADRIHITGFSMGGYGVWDLAMRTPGRFATVAPICGGGEAMRAEQIKDLPCWVFHGEKDDIIPVEASRQMVGALEKAGAKDIRFTVYPDAMHDSWTDTYNNIELYQWVLNHTRGRSGNGGAGAEDQPSLSRGGISVDAS